MRDAASRMSAARAAAQDVRATDADAAPATLVNALGEDGAARALSGYPNERAEIAAHRREIVDRMSREGATVAAIAREAGISYPRVVEIRAELGVGRRR